MGRRGPAPQSAAKLKLTGKYRKDRHAARGDAPAAAGAPKKPRHLKGEAAAHWKAVVPQLVANGSAKALDTAALVMLCEVWALYRYGMDRLAKEPELALVKDTRCNVLAYMSGWEKLAAKLGLTPSDRQRLRVEPEPEEPSSFDVFLDGGRKLA